MVSRETERIGVSVDGRILNVGRTEKTYPQVKGLGYLGGWGVRVESKAEMPRVRGGISRMFFADDELRGNKIFHLALFAIGRNT